MVFWSCVVRTGLRANASSITLVAKCNEHNLRNPDEAIIAGVVTVVMSHKAQECPRRAMAILLIEVLKQWKFVGVNSRPDSITKKDGLLF